MKGGDVEWNLNTGHQRNEQGCACSEQRMFYVEQSHSLVPQTHNSI
jgi:hypothetical protein